MKLPLIKTFLTMFIANFVMLTIADILRGYTPGYAIILDGNNILLSQILPFIFLGGSALGFLLIVITRVHQLDGMYRQAVFYGTLGFSLFVLIAPYIDYREFLQRQRIFLELIYIPFSEYYVSRLLNIGIITYVLGFMLGAWGLYTLLKSSNHTRKPKEKNKPFSEIGNLS